jgi:hypothetical protein
MESTHPTLPWSHIACSLARRCQPADHALQVIEEIRHSVSAIRDLPPDVQLAARHVYYDGLRYAFAASTAVAALSFVSALFAKGSGLRSTK